MCVIITSPSRAKRPTLRHLQLCQAANRHGSGVAWIDGKRVEYIKGLSPDAIHALLAQVKGPAIVHFRIASVGGITPALCHPFPVTLNAECRRHGRARQVLFHNGTWFPHRQAADHFGVHFGCGPVSDTRIAAAIVARLGLDWIAKQDSTSRWVTLDAQNGIQRRGNWVRVAGCHYSNRHWIPASSPTLYDWAEGFLDIDGEGTR